MRVVVINSEKRVGVNDEFYSGIDFELPQNIHAIQWYGTWGEIEFNQEIVGQRFIKPANQTITDFTPYDYIVAAWESGRTQILQRIADEQAERERQQREQAELEAALATKTVEELIASGRLTPQGLTPTQP